MLVVPAGGEIRGIVRVLACWQALTKRAQAVELLALMDLRPANFSAPEWAAPPLSELEADGALSLTSRSTRMPQTAGHAAGRCRQR